jgi:transcriptional regulator with XRE-family HTH domain
MDILQRRLDKGWTQEELALHSGLSTRSIHRAESGKNVGSENLKCFAGVFETSIINIIQKKI